MNLIFGVGAVLLFTACASAINELHPLSDEYISLINSQQTSWTAGRNFPQDTPMSQLDMLLGAILDNNIQSRLPVKEHDSDLIASLPENFDPRLKWPHCLSLNEIRDQGCCGSCWAFGAVETMTDRVCIFSNGTKNFHFSAEDVITCANYKSWRVSNGCNGDIQYYAWMYWKDQGIVSGGGYNSSEGCMPYEIPHNIPHVACIANKTIKLECKKKCRAGFDVEYDKDKHFGKSVYGVKGEEHIKAELFKNGPIEAMFAVYKDFLHYKTGVYQYVQGDYVGEHAVKMLGWGVEGGQKYWLMANSWSTTWGDKGFFKIQRGNDECGVESYLITGEPQ